MRFLLSCAAVLAAWLPSSCRSPSSSAAATPAILAQWSGPYGGTDAPATRAIKTAAEWSALWQQLGREPPRAFDAVKETAVALFLGQRRTGGYQVELIGVRRESDQLVVEYRENTPPRGAAVPQVLTAPWAVAVVSSTGVPIVFRRLSQPGAAQR
jgi:hypothetical protein